MATIEARQSEPGTIYRPTRGRPGVFYTRPKETKKRNARTWINRLLTKGDPFPHFGING